MDRSRLIVDLLARSTKECVSPLTFLINKNEITANPLLTMGNVKNVDTRGMYHSLP